MRFIVIFIIFFSWAVSASAHVYPSNQDGLEQFLKFKPIANAPSFDAKSSLPRNKNNAVQDPISSSTQLMDEKNEVIDGQSHKSNFKRFGNGKTVKKEIENKKELTIEKENICEIPDKKENPIALTSTSDDHKTIPASTNKLTRSVSFSGKTKRISGKKQLPHELSKNEHEQFLEKNETKNKVTENEIKQSISVIDSSEEKPLSADQIMSEKISVEIPSGDIFMIVSKLMPANWRVMMSVKNNKLLNKKFYFVTTKSRVEALNDLSGSVGIKFHYFFDLKDESKNISPLLIVSDN